MAAVNFAREHDLLLSVKGRGRNIAGAALADGGLVIDMGRLRGVLVEIKRRYDPENLFHVNRNILPR